MSMPVRIDDPRLSSPQCISLTPVCNIHSNEWFSVCNRGSYYTVEYKHPQVIVLPVIGQHSVLMVRVKRPVIADITLELPAGSVKSSEMPLEAVAREFTEETGIKIGDPGRFIAEPPIANSPNRNPALIHIYRIFLSQKEYENRASHDDEIESVECYRYKEVKQMLAKGEIYVSAPVAVIGRFLLQKNIN